MLSDVLIRVSLMHVGKIILHILVWKEADVVDPKWLEDVLLGVFVERHARYPFDNSSSPVDAYRYEVHQPLLLRAPPGQNDSLRIASLCLARRVIVILARHSQALRTHHCRMVGSIALGHR